jgi:hypothetical protein
VPRNFDLLVNPEARNLAVFKVRGLIMINLNREGRLRSMQQQQLL